MFVRSNELHNNLTWINHDHEIKFPKPPFYFVIVLAWRVTNHYLKQCWPWRIRPHIFTRPQWMNNNSIYEYIHNKLTWDKDRLVSHVGIKYYITLDKFSKRYKTIFYKVYDIFLCRGKASSKPRAPESEGNSVTHYCAEYANHSAITHPSKRIGTSHVGSHTEPNSGPILGRKDSPLGWINLALVYIYIYHFLKRLTKFHM